MQILFSKLFRGDPTLLDQKDFRSQISCEIPSKPLVCEGFLDLSTLWPVLSSQDSSRQDLRLILHDCIFSTVFPVDASDRLTSNTAGMCLLLSFHPPQTRSFIWFRLSPPPSLRNPPMRPSPFALVPLRPVLHPASRGFF